MKKYILILCTTALLISCTKEKCWILSDCSGNDIGSFCGSEREVQEYCQANGTPGCDISYRVQ